ncbi:MAG: NRDE family protein [Betaproteobacteria bacterium]|nr:NRDE family protein [Betaproteobacteria bacterium]
MCLILLAWRAHPEYPLVVAANRDEVHTRPSAAAAFWEDRPEILGGRDLECRGTWMGITRAGKFAAVTNYRDANGAGGRLSRGLLASRYLENGDAPGEYVRGLAGAAYRGFNFLAGDLEELWWVSNRAAGARRLEPGIHGLSNHLLDTPWPKVARGKERLAGALETAPAVDQLMALLADTSIAPDAELPDTGVGLERERALSAARIVSPVYGTRCSTVLMVGRSGRTRFAERAYDAEGDEGATVQYELRLAA